MTPATEPNFTRSARLIAPLGLAGACLAGAVALHFRDPHEAGSWGFCPFLLVTGHPCPGCGGLRAVNDLTNFDLVGAASSNLLFVASIPLIAWFWLRWVQRAWSGPAVGTPAPAISTRTVALILAAVIGFWILRNLPFASWLLP